jgi:hypothetical protein
MDNDDKKFAIFISISVILVLVLIYIAKRDVDKIEYNTHANQPELSILRGKTVAFFSIHYDDSLLGDFYPPSPDSVVLISEYHKEKYISGLSTLFDIVDNSIEPPMLQEINIRADQTEKIQSILEETGSDGGILVTNCYGYDPLLSIEGELADYLLPKELADGIDVGISETTSEAYSLASDMYIVNREGEVIWNFFGKATKKTYTEVDPSPEDIVKNLEFTIDHYTDYTIWLLNKDLEGSPNKHFFNDYLDNRFRRPITVLPFTNKNEHRWVLLELWDSARSGDWRQYGQWPQAKAAFIIWLSALALFGIVLGAYWAVEQIFSDIQILEWVFKMLALPLLMLLSIVGWLFATFYLLQAIL